jgi:hypothetical protein
MAELMDFIDLGGGDSDARRAEIEEAIESLRCAPLRCPVIGVRDRKTFRRMTVGNRFFVFYLYSPPRGAVSSGKLSIRAVKHAAMESPFLGVREAAAEELIPTRPLRTGDAKRWSPAHP